MSGVAVESLNKAKAEGMATLDEFLSIFLEILLPIALALIGFFVLAPVVGLSGFYNSFMTGVNIGGTAQGAIAMGAAVVTYGGLGFGLVAVERTYDGFIGDIVGAVGWMSIAMGLREALNWLMGGQPMAPSGPLATLSSKLQTGLSSAAQGN